MPASVMVQFSLITTLTPTLTSSSPWCLLMAAMTVPYVFAGITVSLALTRSPFPVSQVYGVDLLGAALGCAAVVGILDVLDGPSAILSRACVAALAALCFRARGPSGAEQHRLQRARWWRRPSAVIAGCWPLIPLNTRFPSVSSR